LKSKYLEYQDEILYLFNEGNGYSYISRWLIEKYHLDISPDTLRKTIKYIVHYLISDKEIVEQNVRLSKQKQKLQDLNRIHNKSFREHARIENAIEGYNKEIIKLLKTESTNLKIKKYKENTEAAILVQLTDTHFNELVELRNNKYDFRIASKRLQKYAVQIKKYAKLFRIQNILVGITGDLMNSDRRLDELTSASTNRAKATFLSVSLIKTFLLELNEIANITIACVTGNESRVKQELGWTDITASDNYDFTIFEMLRHLLPDMKFLTGNALEIVVNIGNKNVLLIHGHQLGRMNTEQQSKVIAKYAAKNIIIDLIICGHLHSTMITDNLCRSGSLVGSNAYSENALNLTGRASQNIYIFTKDGRHDISIDLQNTDNYEGYDINKELEAYNAKSLTKTNQNKTIFKVVI